ncbi:MAG: hypothetical protein NC132_02240 [Corallococcus sp.]|nr:hypothetical protein [Corallococcus sp.]MCM1358929.1 hypothetical protein [Corallococcus sp.]MCM1394917.1 hypothetical protein [Corallococcus sp.]
MKEKPFSPPKRRQPVWKPVSAVLKLCYKKPQIINLNKAMPDKAIFVANHAAMSGPVVYSLYLPYFHVTWGAYQMLGNYKMRYRYLRDVYFVQKRKMSKAGASALASFEAAFSIYFYKGIKVLPTYPDLRFVKTIKNSVACLNDGTSVLVFPENSSDGYREVISEFYGGFVSLAERYRKTHGEDVNICPMYYSPRKNKIVIGKCSKLADYPNMTREQVAEDFRRQVNNLYFEYISDGDRPVLETEAFLR